MKIAVIGYSGAGKSTLAKRLAGHYGIPVFYLDRVQFAEGWAERDRGEANAMVEEILARPDWGIDGNYNNFAQERRLELADQIIFLNFPRRVCLPRVLFRRWAYRNRTRESMAEGCAEKIDLEFLRWVLWDSRTDKQRAHYRGICERHPQKVVVLKRPADAERFQAALGVEELRR